MTNVGGTPPEGELIERARKDLKMSQNEAARRSGISGTRWRQIVSGRQSVATGLKVPTEGPAETVAMMAMTVELSPEDLEQVHRADAASELRKLLEKCHQPLFDEATRHHILATAPSSGLAKLLLAYRDRFGEEAFHRAVAEVLEIRRGDPPPAPNRVEDPDRSRSPERVD